MRVSRPLLISIAAALVVAGVGCAVVLNSSFQTWAVRRSLANHPEIHLMIGRVDAGFAHVDLQDVRYEREGVKLTAPAVALELPLLRAWFQDRWEIRRLTAKGWSVEPAANAAPGPSPSPAPAVTVSEATAAVAGTSTGTATASAVASPKVFHGVLAWLELPRDTSLDHLELAGRVALPQAAGVANVTLQGNGIRAGQAGRIAITADTALTGPAVHAMRIEGVVDVTLKSPRAVGGIAAKLTATASGPKLATPVVLQIDGSATTQTDGEAYAVVIAGGSRKLLDLSGHFPTASDHVTGKWSIDFRDTDVAPFALGHELPTFNAIGQGSIECASTLGSLHAVGRLEASVDRLGVVQPALSAVGPVKLSIDLDAAKHGNVIAITRVDAALAADRPVATARSLQPFELNPRTGDVRASDLARDLFEVKLDALPLAWLQPFVPELSLQGGAVQGALTATPRAGGLSLKTTAPLATASLAIARAGQPLLRELDLSVSATADWTPQGWQAGITGVTVKSGGRTLLLLDTKLGQLVGDQQPVKATGLLSVDLRAAAAQPVAGGKWSVASGDATVDFVASFGAQTQFQAEITAKNLAADPAVTKEKLPTIKLTLRADVRDDSVVINAPIQLSRGGRESDLTLAGRFKPGVPGFAFDAQVSSNQFVLDDAKILGALLRDHASGATTDGATPRPAWAGLNGAVALQLKKLVYSNAFQVSNVVGTLRFAGGAVKFEEVRAGVGEGDAKLNGALRFDPAAVAPLAFGADVQLADFDPGPLFATANPRQPPTVEGRFSVFTKLSAHAPTLGALPAAASGQFELTSKGGTFRGLPISVGNLVENSSKLASWFAAAGNAITSLAGRKDYDEITSRSQAASELAKLLSAISYDQLSLVVTRDESLNATVREFTLISPDFRISGSGQARSTPGRTMLNDVVSLEYHVRARGRAAELMKFLGVLDPRPDDLGYAACTLPFTVGGTLSRLDGTAVSNRLVALAVEKTGLTEKAVDWINRLRGK